MTPDKIMKNKTQRWFLASFRKKKGKKKRHKKRLSENSEEKIMSTII